MLNTEYMCNKTFLQFSYKIKLNKGGMLKYLLTKLHVDNRTINDVSHYAWTMGVLCLYAMTQNQMFVHQP